MSTSTRSWGALGYLYWLQGYRSGRCRNGDTLGQDRSVLTFRSVIQKRVTCQMRHEPGYTMDCKGNSPIEGGTVSFPSCLGAGIKAFMVDRAIEKPGGFLVRVGLMHHTHGWMYDSWRAVLSRRTFDPDFVFREGRSCSR